MNRLSRCAAVLLGLAVSGLTPVQAAALPAPTSPEFCTSVQLLTANTVRTGTNEVFTDMPAYRASKPMVNPHTTFQVVSYRGQMPVMVSCKVKGSAHLRSEYGDDAAGEQVFCPSITRLAQAQAVAELEKAGDDEAAAKAAAIVVEENEPYTTGASYLSDFELSFVGEDGAIYINSPGLFQDYDSWVTLILPERVEGQVYCHLATAEYLQALATGAMEPGTLMTTADDAPVTPQAE